ncbi:hypothetical protein L7F22_029440 [Adiantum nelumboides]|nr:hypothetical protein [Adiantum nelumboides]
MSPLHMYLDLQRLALIQDEFKIELEQTALNSPTSYLSRSGSSISNSSARSEGQSSNFSFSAAYHSELAGADYRCLHIQAHAYADEIFHNGKIRPLHDQARPLAVEAIALYAEFSVLETLQVHEDRHPAAAACSPSLTPNIITSPVAIEAIPLYQSSESEHGITSTLPSVAATPIKMASRRSLSKFLPLRRVWGSEDECASSPSSKCSSCSHKTHLLTHKHPHFSFQAKVSTLHGQAHGKSIYLKKTTPFVHHSPSAHALHYYNSQHPLSCTPQRASKKNMSKRTSLPYRTGILACIGY